MMLRELQKQFLNDLFNNQSSPKIESSILNTGSRTALEQFQSYRDSVIGGMIDALADSFPVIQQLVGEQFFNFISSRYIRITPSLSPDLNNYGGGFADFIETLDNLEALPYLSDVARLEWYWQHIINGGNCKPSNLTQLAELGENDSDTIIFSLCPHANVLHSDYAIHKIWQANQQSAVDTQNTQIDINNNVNLLVWRNELTLEMNITLLDSNQLFFLALINQGMIFSEVCSVYDKKYPDDDIGVILSHCIQSGWIHSFKLTTELL